MIARASAPLTKKPLHHITDMLDIYVDADACPVKSETLRVAGRHHLEVYIVSNAWLRPLKNPKVHVVRVEAGADVADDWIVEHIGENDIVVTADILLANRCLNHLAYALSPYGKPFTDDNIGNAVAGRNLNAHLRELGETSGFNPSFTPKDRSRFLQILEETIQTIKRL